MGTWDDGLSQRDPVSGCFTHLRHRAGDARSLPNDIVTTLHPARDGGLWVGTCGGGVARLYRATGRFRTYGAAPAGPLSHATVYGLHETLDGVLWIATGGGLNRIDPATGTVRVLTTRNGQPHNIVYAVLPDDAGRLWLSTNHGLAVYDPARNAVVRTYHSGGRPPGRLQGVARAEGGKPLAGALLTAHSLDGAVVGFALTDSRGAYTLDAEQGAQLILQADAPRYGVRAAAATLTGALGFVNVDLSPVMPVSNQDRAEALTGVAIRGLAPNPARTSARALVEVAEAGPARIALFDVLGREVAVLADGELAAGAHEVSLDTARLAPGVYVVRVQTPRGVAAQRLTVVR